MDGARLIAHYLGPYRRDFLMGVGLCYARFSAGASRHVRAPSAKTRLSRTPAAYTRRGRAQVYAPPRTPSEQSAVFGTPKPDFPTECVHLAAIPLRCTLQRCESASGVRRAAHSRSGVRGGAYTQRRHPLRCAQNGGFAFGCAGGF